MQRVSGDTCELSEANLLLLSAYVYTVSRVISVFVPCRVDQCQAEP